MRFNRIKCADDIVRIVQETGFLPFFANDIEGFSIEENCARELWFSGDADGPWEWKGPIARSGKCVYGKFFGGKAGFVSTEWFPELANYRRNGYDFDARYDDGLASRKDKDVYDTIAENGSILSKRLKAACNYRKDGNKGFETVITRLQMQTYVNISDFVYMRDKHGNAYGWGVAQYSTPEELFGYDAVTSSYKKEPEASEEHIISHLSGILTDVSEDKLKKLLK